MMIKNFVKFVGVVFLIIGAYNTCLNILALCYRMFPFFLHQTASEIKPSVSLLFITNFMFYLLIMTSGFELIRLKRNGIRVLYFAIIIFLVDGVMIGVYQETFNMLVSPTYTWVGKGLIVAYLCWTKLLMPTIVIVLFRYPKILSVFHTQKKGSAPEI